jgi:hypothetical protein
VRKNAQIKLSSFFSVVIEPEEWSKFIHGSHGTRQQVTDDKPTFYEQVTEVKGLVFVFSFIASLFFVVVFALVAPHVALHRVSIRTLDELS